MISAATQTLADFIASGIALINREQIYFDHPSMHQRNIPALNLYCYRVQASSWHCPSSSQDCSRAGTLPDLAKQQICQWFDLTFLISAVSHTALAEQHLLSEMLAMFSNYSLLPEEFLPPVLRGQGQLPIAISTEAVPNNLLFWQVLRTPLRLALHVTITVPCWHPLGFYERAESYQQPGA